MFRCYVFVIDIVGAGQEDLGDARQTSETIHKAVEDFVGNAEPNDDLTKMCIKMR